VLLLYSIVVGLLVGKLLGGSLSALSEVRIHWMGLALIGLLGQVVLFSDQVTARIGSAGPALYVGSTLLVLAALLRNLKLPGFAVISVGAFLNLIAILTNGGYMPSSPDAWAALNGVAQLPKTGYTNSALIGPNTPLPFLGDVFYLPHPIPFANVFSIGDVVIAIGAVWFLVAAMRGRAGKRSELSPLPSTRQPAAGTR
jgi:Family of unknown function (DUF5317)